MEPVILGSEVTIATAAYGNAAATQLCLQSIMRSAVGDFQLLLIDDCSPDSARIREIYLAARHQHPNTAIFSFTENLEYSGSVNAILSHAVGQWVFFVSNDIFVTPTYLRTLLDVARANPRFGILRGSSNFVDNGLPTHNLTLKKSLTTLDEMFQASAACMSAFGQAVHRDPFLVGDAFLAARPLIDRIGTFDPYFYGYFADPDYGLRAQIAGFQLALVPGAFAFHSRNANFEYLPEAERKAKLDRRLMRVFENWARFKLKYDLPVPMPYETIAGLPWDRLSAVPFDERRHYSPPGDYSRFLI